MIITWLPTTFQVAPERRQGVDEPLLLGRAEQRAAGRRASVQGATSWSPHGWSSR